MGLVKVIFIIGLLVFLTGLILNFTNFTGNVVGSTGEVVQIHKEAETGNPNTFFKINDESASGKFYIKSTSKNVGSATYELFFTKSDFYYIWAKVIAPSEINNTLTVKLDDHSPDFFDAAEGTFSDEWQWSRVNGRGLTDKPLTINPRKFSISKGSHIVTMKGVDDGVIIDKLIFVNDIDFVPEIEKVNKPEVEIIDVGEKEVEEIIEEIEEENIQKRAGIFKKFWCFISNLGDNEGYDSCLKG
jgi:hypothetical protein